MRKQDKAWTILIFKFLEWLEKNSHRFQERHIKRIYAEVMGYYRAFKSGNLTAKQAERLSRRILFSVLILASYLIAKYPNHKQAAEILAVVPFTFVENAKSTSIKSLAKNLRKVFRHGPTINNSMSLAAKKVNNVARSTAMGLASVLRRRKRRSS